MMVNRRHPENPFLPQFETGHLHDHRQRLEHEDAADQRQRQPAFPAVRRAAFGAAYFLLMAYIGLIMLAGIAVNNSIILVDRINQLMRDGLDRKMAIIQAGQQRIRPIIMTSLTTILALLPLTIGFGESASLRSPMALAVIGGLVTSTILSLVLIPCVYWVLDSFKDIVTGQKKEQDYIN